MNKIYEMTDTGYEDLIQYYKDGWKCEIDDEIPLTIVASSTDMMEATGEDEYKDYPIIPSLGVVNKEIHKSITEDMNDGADIHDEFSDLYDVQSYCGFVNVEDIFFSIDKSNDNLQDDLKISDACIKSYKCRFTGETKYYPAFKTMETCNKFLESLINKYGDVFMSTIGFHLDRPVNLIGETGWKTIELCKNGIK